MLLSNPSSFLCLTVTHFFSLLSSLSLSLPPTVIHHRRRRCRDSTIVVCGRCYLPECSNNGKQCEVQLYLFDIKYFLKLSFPYLHPPTTAHFIVWLVIYTQQQYCTREPIKYFPKSLFENIDYDDDEIMVYLDGG